MFTIILIAVGIMIIGFGLIGRIKNHFAKKNGEIEINCSSIKDNGTVFDSWMGMDVNNPLNPFWIDPGEKND
jgi:hypothetical protein